MSSNVIAKKTPPTSANNSSNTSYLSTMAPKVSSNINTTLNKRRECSIGEDSGVQIDHDSLSKTVFPTNIVPSVLPSPSPTTTPKITDTTTPPTPYSTATSSSSSCTMVTTSTLIPPIVDVKPSLSSSSSPLSSPSTLLPRKDSNASSSGAFSEISRSFGHDENSNDSLFGLIPPLLSHHVIKCNLNTTTNNMSNSSTSTPTPPLTPSPPTLLTPRVTVTVQQTQIKSQPSAELLQSKSTSPSILLKTPTTSTLPIFSSSIITTNVASSAPEFSISAASSIDDSEELGSYEPYLSVSCGRQSNPSPEMRRKAIDEWNEIQQKPIPRSRSDVNSVPIEALQQQQPQQQLIITSQDPVSYVSEDDDSTSRISATNNSTTAEMTKKKKSKAATIAKDFKSRAANLIRRRTTEATVSEKSHIPSREDVQSWEQSFDSLLRHRYGQALFRAFLRTEFSEENLEFWLACDEFRTCKEPKRSAKAKKIYMDFIAIGATKQVNLDTETRMSTIANIDNPPLDTFDRAQRRIQGLMEKDSYQRFLKSELYINLSRRAAYPVQRRTTAEVTPKSS